MKIYMVVAEHRSSDPEYHMFFGEDAKEKAEKCYLENLPIREHDAVELYEIKANNGKATFFYPEKREEK